MREYLLTLLVAAGATYLLVGPSSRLAHLVGAVPPARDRDVHPTPVPRLGGIAMLGGMLAAMLVASYLPRMSERVFDESTHAQALVTAAVVMCAVGIADDIWNLSALMKFAGQLLAAGLLVVQGLQLVTLPLPSGGYLSFSQPQGAVLTVLMVVATVNAVNFVDGLDGLAAGVVGIGATASFSYAYLLAVEGGYSRLTTSALVTAVLCGMCAGFLPHNVHPARVFMGDSGAMLIGLMLAAGSISLTGSFPTTPESATFLLAILPLLLPLAVIALPFTDLLLAVLRRTRAGRSPFAPDKQHLHHRLLALGHSHGRAVFLMWVWAALVAFGLVVAALVGGWTTPLIIGVAVLLTVVFTTGHPRALLGNHR
ncbi:MAG: undecaprenyl/decaprenyl-phosphate alpha-N-acetylglucosaminyl 1-phosphate transferase [Jiangellaceae bacterium]|nr:undecaprenyl/decaprenyl-phosphate alpha-N-acetylglucosaminyl 1-phosphate transferase [Jiangellaceae bacterium]